MIVFIFILTAFNLISKAYINKMISRMQNRIISKLGKSRIGVFSTIITNEELESYSSIPFNHLVKNVSPKNPIKKINAEPWNNLYIGLRHGESQVFY